MTNRLRLLSYSLSALFLAVIFWRLRLQDLAGEVAGIDWALLAVGASAGVGAVCLQAARWRYLLQPPRLRYRLVLQATYLGALVNAVLPLRTGEVVRGAVVAKRTHRGLAGVLATQVVERVSDALAMVILVAVAMHGVTLPASLQFARTILYGVVVALVVVVGVLALRQAALRSRLTHWRPQRRLGTQVRRVSLDLSTGLALLRNAKALAVTVASSLGMVGLQVVMLWFALRAYHIDLGFVQAAGVVSVISIGTAVPTMPSNVGSWQLSCVLGLSLFGVPAETAAGFSLVAFIVLSLVQICGGIIALATSPFSFGQLRQGHRGETALGSPLDQAAEAEA